MYNLKNLANSPYTITLIDGNKEILPARGELKNVAIHPMNINEIKLSGFILLSRSEPADAKEPRKRTKK